MRRQASWLLTEYKKSLRKIRRKERWKAYGYAFVSALVILASTYAGYRGIVQKNKVVYMLAFLPIFVVAGFGIWWANRDSATKQQRYQEEVYQSLKELRRLYEHIGITTLRDVSKMSDEMNSRILEDNDSIQKRINLMIVLAVPSLILGPLSDIIKQSITIVLKNSSDPHAMQLAAYVILIVVIACIGVAVIIFTSSIFEVGYWDRLIRDYVSMYQYGAEKGWCILETAEYVASSLG